MSTTSPTQRTLKYLRDKGYIVAITERWNAFAKIRQDLFGCLDLVALDTANQKIIGVQTTSTPNMAARIEKIKALSEAKAWSACGGKLLVIGWAKRGARGERKVWTPKVVRLVFSLSWYEFDEPS